MLRHLDVDGVALSDLDVGHRADVPARVRRGEIVNLGRCWLKGHGLSVGSEVLGLSSRVRRTAPSLQMQSQEPQVASCGLAKTPL